MEKLKFEFKCVAAADGKANTIIITSITDKNNVMYKLPEEDIYATKHTLLVETPAYAKVKNSLKKRHQMRKVWITLSEEMKEIYLDEEENLQFNDKFLEEIDELQKIVSEEENPMIKLLEKLIENTQRSEEKSLTKITKEFMTEKFSSKISNAGQWISEFEKECERFNINQDKRKIEALKFFLDKPILDWYGSMLLKLTINSEWDQWKTIFCETFANKGWSPIRYALSFRYQTGSLIDYAIKKEKLLLEIRRTMDTGTLIDLIASGLPNFIVDKIDRESVQTTEELCNEIGKLEHLIKKKSVTLNNNKNEFQKKMPCKVCKDKGKGTRFHAEDKCWFNNEKKELEHTSLLEVENYENPKN